MMTTMMSSSEGNFIHKFAQRLSGDSDKFCERKKYKPADLTCLDDKRTFITFGTPRL